MKQQRKQKMKSDDHHDDAPMQHAKVDLHAGINAMVAALEWQLTMMRHATNGMEKFVEMVKWQQDTITRMVPQTMTTPWPVPSIMQEPFSILKSNGAGSTAERAAQSV
jgi:hypothetical protein